MHKGNTKRHLRLTDDGLPTDPADSDSCEAQPDPLAIQVACVQEFVGADGIESLLGAYLAIQWDTHSVSGLQRERKFGGGLYPTVLVLLVEGAIFVTNQKAAFLGAEGRDISAPAFTHFPPGSCEIAVSTSK